MSSQKDSKAPVNFIDPGGMGAIVLAGGMGAALNYALYPHLEERFSLPVNKVLQDMGYMENSLDTLKSVLTVVFGFFGGMVLLFFCVFLKTMVVRFLLDYNGWFLTPRNPLNKVWFMLMVVLVGTKNRGAGKYQDYLPSLPVPPLKSTLKKYIEFVFIYELCWFPRYLNSVRPLLTKEEYQATEAAVEEFRSKDGWKLQLLLNIKSWTTRNWLSQWWCDMIYLRQRTPIPFNSNYFALGGRDSPTPHGLDRAACLVYYFLGFYLKVQVSSVENAMSMGVVPMCMSGYKYLGATTRIPGKEIDRVDCYTNKKPTYCVVVRRGKFFQLELFSKSGRFLSPKMIKKQLEKIVEMAGDEEDTAGVASFTALPRAKWAEVRMRLEENPANKRILHLIDSALTLLVLESEPVKTSDMAAVSKMLFHGNINNRWFDKSVQLIVCPIGTIGANVEHSSLDATVCGQAWEYGLTSEQYDEDGHVVDIPGEEVNPEFELPVHLNWELQDFENDLAESRTNLQQMIADSDILPFTPSYGKGLPKKIKLSPDGWFQMAMQLAYYRMYNTCVLTYESATTRLYYQGRTETIRPVSDDSVAFVKSFDDPNVPREEVKEMLKRAIHVQCKYKMEAMRGLGVDRHLFGLFVVAKALNLDPMPKLFSDKAFNLSYILSTSQTPVKMSDRWTPETTTFLGGFGTVLDNGYGVSYIVVSDDEVNFLVHSRHSCPTTNSKKFADAIFKAFQDMRELYFAELDN